MTRSLYKGYYCDWLLYTSIVSKKKEKIIKVKERSSTILPLFVGHSVMIHNGVTLKYLKIKTEHVGHKFGEFSLTTKMGSVVHISKKNMKRKLKLKRKK